MATRRAPRIYQATDSFYFGSLFVSRGDTVVDGHPLLRARKHLFRDFQPTFGSLEPEPEPTPEPEPAPEPVGVS